MTANRFFRAAILPVHGSFLVTWKSRGSLEESRLHSSERKKPVARQSSTRAGLKEATADSAAFAR